MNGCDGFYVVKSSRLKTPTFSFEFSLRPLQYISQPTTTHPSMSRCIQESNANTNPKKPQEKTSITADNTPAPVAAEACSKTPSRLHPAVPVSRTGAGGVDTVVDTQPLVLAQDYPDTVQDPRSWYNRPFRLIPVQLWRDDLRVGPEEVVAVALVVGCTLRGMEQRMEAGEGGSRLGAVAACGVGDAWVGVEGTAGSRFVGVGDGRIRRGGMVEREPLQGSGREVYRKPERGMMGAASAEARRRRA